MSDDEFQPALFGLDEDKNLNSSLRQIMRSDTREIEAKIDKIKELIDKNLLEYEKAHEIELKLRLSLNDKFKERERELVLHKSLCSSFKKRYESIKKQIDEVSKAQNELNEVAMRYYSAGESGLRFIEESKNFEAMKNDLKYQINQIFDDLNHSYQRAEKLKSDYADLSCKCDYAVKVSQDKKNEYDLNKSKLERLELELERQQRIIKDIYHDSMKKDT